MRSTSARRPSRVASAIAGSMWSVKNWNGLLLLVLLAHEDERRLEREEHAGERDAVRVGRQAVAERAVADLVVVLRARRRTARALARVSSRTSPSIEPKSAK